MKLMEMPFETESDKQWFNNLLHKPERPEQAPQPQRLQIKVCGMRDAQNIHDVAQAGADLMGFIFYPESKRYVGADFDSLLPRLVHRGVRTVGVFVNHDPEQILHLQKRYQLDLVQLHGAETPATGHLLRQAGVQVIKAFGIGPAFDFDSLRAWDQAADYFLFDTATPQHGGSGQKFDWQLLNNYQLRQPFLLSGGIGPLDAEAILQLEHPRLWGIDLNSRFELRPAHKDAALLEAFIKVVRRKNCTDCPQAD